MARLFRFVVLVCAGSIVFGQAGKSPTSKPDAITILQKVDHTYSDVKIYHIEAVEETEMNGAMYRQWDKTVLSAIFASGNRYRLEARSNFGSSLKVSDGKTETFLNSESGEYKQGAVAGAGPMPATGITYPWAFGMTQVSSLLKGLTRSSQTLLSPIRLPDEELVLNEKPVPCYVLKGKTKYRGGSYKTVGEITLWIEKETWLIRKEKQHSEGPVIANSSADYVDDRTTIYPVMDLGNTPGVAESAFQFQAPAGGRLVEAFSNPYEQRNVAVGELAPAIVLRTAAGKEVALRDFHGKPVLLDFWATWCAPCVAALEPLNKLHQEGEAKGLIVLSVNEDDDDDGGNTFLAKKGISWPNFHDADGEIWRSFHTNGGVPFYVLINGNGQVVFAKAGARDTELRTEIAKLGITLSSGSPAGSGPAK